MRPLVHVLSSGAVVLAYAVRAGLPEAESAAWVVCAVAATLLLDLDHFILQLLMEDRRRQAIEMLAHPLEYADWRKVVDRMHYPGFGILRMKSHIIVTAAATLLLGVLHNPYSAPILLSLWVHTAVDLIQTAVSPKSR